MYKDLALIHQNNLQPPLASDYLLTREEKFSDLKETNSDESDEVWSYPKCIKEMAVFSFPFFSSRFFTWGSNFVFGIMLSKLDTESLAAFGLINSTQNLLITSTSSILFATGILSARRYGASENLSIGSLVQHSKIFAFCIAVPISLLAYFSGDILKKMGQPINLIGTINNYFRSYLWGIPATLMLVVDQQFLLGVKRPWTVFIVVALSSLLNIALAYPLIFGTNSIPKLGMKGLGYASSISQWTTLLGMNLLLLFSKNIREKFNFFSIKCHTFLSDIKELAKLGLPIGLQVGIELLILELNSIMLGWLGAGSLKAQQISMQTTYFLILPFFSMSLAGELMVSQAMGKGNAINAKRIGNVSIIMGTGLVASAGLVCIVGAKALVKIFIRGSIDEELYSLALQLLYLNASSMVLDAVRNMATGNLRGLKDVAPPVVTSLLSLGVIALPTSYALAFLTNLSAKGLVVGKMIGLIFGAGYLLNRWHNQINAHEKKLAEDSIEISSVENHSFEKERSVDIVIKQEEIEEKKPKKKCDFLNVFSIFAPKKLKENVSNEGRPRNNFLCAIL